MMTLNEFISHIKHKSLSVKIYKGGVQVYDGSVGTYECSVYKINNGSRKVRNVVPEDNLLNISVEE